MDHIQYPKLQNGSDENESKTDLCPSGKPETRSEIESTTEIDVLKEADSFKSGTPEIAEKNNGSA